MTKRALILAGGGAKGAYQVGALKYIETVLKPAIPDFKFDIIAGVSVGALNGSFMAMERFEDLEKLWDTITAASIYSGKLKLLPILWRVATGQKGVIGNQPLFNQLQESVSMKDIKVKNFHFGAVSLNTGDYYSLTYNHFDNDNDFRKGILASTAMPLIWPPVKEININENGTKKTLLNMVDGGAKNITPIGDVLDYDPDELYIINCAPRQVQLDNNPTKSIFTIGFRSIMEITTNAILMSDINQFTRMNALAQEVTDRLLPIPGKPGRYYKYIKSYIINPAESIGNTLDFSREMLSKRNQLGYKDAEAVLGNYVKEFQAS